MRTLEGAGSRCPEVSPLEGEKAAFQIRSRWAQFLMRERFWRVEKSITYVFSISLNIPTPPASTISKRLNWQLVNEADLFAYLLRTLRSDVTFAPCSPNI
jgi:hypothetical protein